MPRQLRQETRPIESYEEWFRDLTIAHLEDRTPVFLEGDAIRVGTGISLTQFVASMLYHERRPCSQEAADRLLFGSNVRLAKVINDACEGKRGHFDRDVRSESLAIMGYREKRRRLTPLPSSQKAAEPELVTLDAPTRPETAQQLRERLIRVHRS